MVKISPTNKYVMEGYALANAHYKIIQFRPISDDIFEIIFKDNFYDEIMKQYGFTTSIINHVTIYITSRRLTFIFNKINLEKTKNNTISLAHIHAGNIDKVIF